jgi:hypothetical protein
MFGYGVNQPILNVHNQQNTIPTLSSHHISAPRTLLRINRIKVVFAYIFDYAVLV